MYLIKNKIFLLLSMLLSLTVFFLDSCSSCGRDSIVEVARHSKYQQKRDEKPKSAMIQEMKSLVDNVSKNDLIKKDTISIVAE